MFICNHYKYEGGIMAHRTIEPHKITEQEIPALAPQRLEPPLHIHQVTHKICVGLLLHWFLNELMPINLNEKNESVLVTCSPS